MYVVALDLKMCSVCDVLVFTLLVVDVLVFTLDVHVFTLDMLVFTLDVHMCLHWMCLRLHQ